MVTFMRQFKNEQGNEITMSVTYQGGSVIVSAIGPNSQVEHAWTPMEIAVLRELLDPTQLEPSYKGPVQPER